MANSEEEEEQANKCHVCGNNLGSSNKGAQSHDHKKSSGKDTVEQAPEQEDAEDFVMIDGKDIPRPEDLEANGKPYGGTTAPREAVKKGKTT